MRTTRPLPLFPPASAGVPERLLAAVLVLAVPGALTQAGDIFVDDDGSPGAGGTSFADAIPDLQHALALAVSGDRIFVAVGAYTPHPSDPSQSFFLKDGVALYGGFDGTESTLTERAGLFQQTVLWKSRHVLQGVSVTSTAVLDGFRIEQGVAVSATSGTLSADGGGLRLVNSSPVVRNCFFALNKALGASTSLGNSGGGGYGGAASISGGSPTFSLCVFEGNRAEGGETFTKPSPGGFASGGAVFNDGGQVSFRHCSFFGNEAIGGDSNGFDEQFFFGDYGGDARGGAISSIGGSLTLDHCLFASNRTSGGFGFNAPGFGEGGAVHATPAALTNCTVHGNVADTVGGVSISGSVENSVLWNNVDNGVSLFGAQLAGTVALSFSDVEGYTPAAGGVGNFSLDPKFVDPDGVDWVAGTADDDLRLLPDSPCIDAGSNALVAADLADIDEDGDVGEPVPLDLALQPRFVDRSATPDTGAGGVAIVDLGPLEHATLCQPDLGFGGGMLHLSLCGDELTLPGSIADIAVTGATAGDAIFLVLGTNAAPTPFYDGFLVPVPPAIVVSGLVAGPGGALHISVKGKGGPPIAVYVQCIAVGGATGAMVRLSNALAVGVGA